MGKHQQSAYSKVIKYPIQHSDDKSDRYQNDKLKNKRFDSSSFLKEKNISIENRKLDNSDSIKKKNVDNRNQNKNQSHENNKQHNNNNVNVKPLGNPSIVKSNFEDFDYDAYLNMYQDVKKNIMSHSKNNYQLKVLTWNHWINNGCKEGRYMPRRSHNDVDVKHSDIFITVNTTDQVLYYNLKTKEMLMNVPTKLIENVSVFVDDFDKYKEAIGLLYNQYCFLNCDILCPCIFDDNNRLLYFGGYELNNNIELFDESHYPHLEKLDEVFYNKKTNVLFRGLFIAKQSISIDKIILNLNNSFQYTNLHCIVTPYVKIILNKLSSYDKFIGNNQNKYIHIENEVIIENELLNKSHFKGNVLLKTIKTVLITEFSIPIPSNDCGSKYVYEFMKLLIKNNYEVHFFSQNRAFLETTKLFKQIGVYVHYDRINCSYGSFEYFLQNNSFYFDYIFLSRYDVCNMYRTSVRKISPSSKLIFFTHDICHKRLNPNATNREIIKTLEMSNIKECDLSIIVSFDEIEYLKSENISENKLFYYPICYEKIQRNNRLPINNTKGLYFIGSLHTPNVEAINYFLNNIWVQVVKIDPTITLHIIGSCGNTIKNNHKNVKICGRICDEELDTLLNSMRINIVPLLSGGGMKGKVLQSFNHGVPVITTDIGIQGMKLCHERDVIVIDANDSVKCAKDICNYYHKTTLLDTCRINAMNYFDENFSSTKSVSFMNNMFQKLDTIIPKQLEKKCTCLVLCVVYNYLDAIEIIYDFLQKIGKNINFVFYFIINNLNIFDEAKTRLNNVSNVHFVKGDNSCREFSGFQSQINDMIKQNKFENIDSVLITNETLLTNVPTSHIFKNVTNEIFLNASSKKVIYGLIDNFPARCSINNYTLQKWIRGNFILLNIKIFREIDFKIHYFNDTIIGDNLKYKLPISKKYDNLIDKWLTNKRYKNMSNHDLRIKKTCIINEHYLGAILMKFDVKDIR